jgi:hypothetical protein
MRCFFMGRIPFNGSIPALGKTPSGDRVKRLFAKADAIVEGGRG